MRKILKRIAGGGVLLLLLLAVAAAAGFVWLRGELRASLPRIDGRAHVAGLAAEVRIDRDAAGVPTIRGHDRLDVARALGFLHGQERFFQMDLLRRRAAGELSELFGEGTLDTDRSVRLHRFRSRAERNVRNGSAGENALLEAYAAGVNAGLADLGSPPPEYVLLRAEPVEWRREDSALVMLAMFIDLQASAVGRESALGLMHATLPAPLVEFLAPWGTSWDAPLIGDPLATPPIPGPGVFDLRGLEVRPAATRLPGDRAIPPPLPGSNNWAVAGAQTADGGALLANDMHLGHQMPNLWYRAFLEWPSSAAGAPVHRVGGVTLPGVPAIVAGSNRHVAWGFTNSYGDWSDMVLIEPDDDDTDRYRTAGGSVPYERHPERIRVRGGDDVSLEVVSTRWGPIVGHAPDGRARALRWTAHDEAASNLTLAEMETARTLEEALDVAHRSGMPAQNLVVAASDGRIAWSLIGKIPRRVGFDGRVPASWADGTRRWDGWLESAEYPTLIDPAGGRLWTANNRVVDGTMLAAIGDGGYALGARATQIRDGLRALERSRPEQMLAIQLDDRALFLDRWRTLLLDLLDERAVEGDPRRRELRRLVEEDWSGRASVDSTGYRMVRGFRLFVAQQIFDAITAPCRDVDPEFDFTGTGLRQWEGPLWKLIDEKPIHLLNPVHGGWDDQLLAGVDATLDYFLDDDRTLAERAWGRRNVVRFRHPLTRAVPALSRWLDIPPASLPGDLHMPRVQSTSFGASLRMVVSPGREEQGLFHMPGGQSGHFLSPFYRAGHQAWAEGLATPFLPGPAVHGLDLLPG